MSGSPYRQRLAAILAADAVGYSGLMARDEPATVAALDVARGVFRGGVEANQGRVTDTPGDFILAVFDIATGALSAALTIQRQLEAAAQEVPEDARMRFRIGVHLGEIIEKPDGSVYGDGVNVAARLQALAQPGGIAVSDAVKGAVGCRCLAQFVDQGEQAMKNIPGAIRWHQAVPAPSEGRAAVLRAKAAVTRTAAELDAMPSIAILPFGMAGADTEDVCLADGLRTDIQWALAKIAGLILIGTPTTNGYREREVTPQRAAAEMGARYLLQAFVQRSGDRVRITASLVEGASGQIVWTEQYDRVLNDSLEVQDEIAERIVTALDVKLLNGDQARVWRRALRHPKAREHFYRGMHEFTKGTKEANAAAREAFEQVSRLAPESSIGPTAVALSHWWDAFRGWTASSERSFGLALQWAERAMPMEDADGQAHTVMAHIHLLRGEHQKALEMAEDAVALRPGCSTANAHFGNILYYCGRPADAADRVNQAMRLTPVHPPWFKVVLAASCREAGRWGEATAAAREALRVRPEDIDARLVLIDVCQLTGNEGAARELARELSALKPDFSVAKWAASQPYQDRVALERISARLRSAGLPP